MNTANTSTPFPALVITTVEYLKSEHDPAQVRFLFPSVLFGSGVIKTVEQALEFIFRQCNRVDGTEWISSEEFQDCYPFPVRSLSVGDVVRFVGSGGFRACYVCESVGWKEISPEDANWLVDCVSPRDFWGSFDETVNRNQHEWERQPQSNTVEDKLSDELGYDSHAHLRDDSGYDDKSRDDAEGYEYEEDGE